MRACVAACVSESWTNIVSKISHSCVFVDGIWPNCRH